MIATCKLCGECTYTFWVVFMSVGPENCLGVVRCIVAIHKGGPVKTTHVKTTILAPV